MILWIRCVWRRLCALCSQVCCWRVLEQIAELDSSAGATQTTVEAKRDVNLNIPNSWQLSLNVSVMSAEKSTAVHFRRNVTAGMKR